jgi:hypothetical protein
MSILDDYNQNASDDGSPATDPADSRKDRAELERQIVMSDSDLKRVLREKADFESEQKRLKKAEERIRIERDALDENIKNLQNNQMLLEEEIRGLKKKLKVLK